MANEIKPKKGAVVKEINGVKYFKLQSKYPGDYTKNCGLLGNEIDENFYFLRSNDIDTMSFNDGVLTLTRVDGDKLSANISMPYTFEFDQKTGQLIITDSNGNVQVLDGFIVEGNDIKVATDYTLNGDGTKVNPLRLSEMEKTGTYAPADEFIDMVAYEYYARSSEESYNYYYLAHDPIDQPFTDTTPKDYIELTEVPTEVTFESPKFIKIKKEVNLPDSKSIGAGYRVVTRESKDNFGLLYNYDGVKKIQQALNDTGSLWRIPTRRDWGLMLNAAEYCDDFRNHDTKCVNLWTGKDAGARAKSHGMMSERLPKEEQGLWKWTDRKEKGLPVCGEDSLPKSGNNKFTVYPVGYADGSRGMDDKDFDLEGFTKKASFWSITPTNCEVDNCDNSNIFTRTFDYSTRKVLQESSKPYSRMSIRLVKDFKPGQMDVNEVENILGYDMPVVLITNDETGYSKLWTSINVGFSEKQYDGVYSNEWSAATGTDRGREIVFYVNEWDGKKWHKKQMNEGDSIVLLDGGDDESGHTIYNHEWRVYSGETEPMLIDTAEALKEEFKKELDEINDKIDDLSGATQELSAYTHEEVERLDDRIEAIELVEVEPTDATILKSYELHEGDIVKGVRIDIPKDKSISDIRLGHVGATINSETGEITDGPAENSEALLIAYQRQDGNYDLAVIDLEEFIIENEFKDGFEVRGNQVYIKIDPESDSYLTVSENGLKLSGVTSEIARLDEKIDDEIKRATSAETALQEDIDELSAATQVFSAATVAELERLDGQDISNGVYEISIDGLILNRKNGEEIEISFNGNFGTDMPTPRN